MPQEKLSLPRRLRKRKDIKWGGLSGEYDEIKSKAQRISRKTVVQWC